MTTTPAAIESHSVSGGAGTQTGALLLDAYRDLQSRKLFWLCLALSAIVAGAFGFVGINQRGLTIFTKEFPSPFNTLLIPPATFYKLMFTEFAIPFWLGFLASALALVAVGGIFPDMISGGSIDLYLSKPIGRLRLFLTKYAFGLLFAAAQVAIFSITSFFVIGIRGGAWEPGIFLAIPLVTLFFSYLYCVCVLVGILTRSALASILLTILFWGMLFVLHMSDMALTTLATAAEHRVRQQERLIAFNQEVIDRNNALPPQRRGDVSQFEFQLRQQSQNLVEYRTTAADLRWWQRLIYGIKTPLPKTNETVDLMSRWLVEPDALLRVQQEEWRRDEQRRARRGGPATRRSDRLGRIADTPEVERELSRTFGARHVGWIIGTSVGFEIVVLGIAGWIFSRRDY